MLLVNNYIYALRELNIEYCLDLIFVFYQIKVYFISKIQRKSIKTANKGLEIIPYHHLSSVYNHVEIMVHSSHV